MAINTTGRDYSPAELETLRIERVHFLDSLMLCGLSDGNVLCVPLSISSRLGASRPNAIYQYVICEDGHEVTWMFEGLSESLTLREMLRHPKAEIRPLSSADKLLVTDPGDCG